MTLVEKLKDVGKEVGRSSVGLLPGMSAYSMAKGLNFVGEITDRLRLGCLRELIQIPGTAIMAGIDFFASIGLYYDLPYDLATKELSHPELHITAIGLLAGIKMTTYCLGKNIHELEKSKNDR